MANIFSASEIVQLGVQIEKNGKDFYLAAAKKSKNDRAREIFEYLANEEEKHIEVFQDILSGVETYEPPESYPGEYFAYLRALSEEYIFTREKKGAEIGKKVKDDKEAINLGIDAEKDSILLYTEMKKFVLKTSYETLDKLIEEEQNHFRKLLELKKENF